MVVYIGVASWTACLEMHKDIIGTAPASILHYQRVL